MSNRTFAPRNEERLLEDLGAGELLGAICSEWYRTDGPSPVIRLASVCRIQLIAGPKDRVGFVTWGLGEDLVKSSFKNNTLEIGDDPDRDPDYPLNALLNLGIVVPRDADVEATLREDEASVSISDQVAKVTLDMAGNTFAHVDKARILKATLNGRTPRMHDHPMVWATLTGGGDLDISVANGAHAEVGGRFADVRLISRDPGSHIEAKGKVSGSVLAESDGYVNFAPGSVRVSPGKLDVVLGRQRLKQPSAGPELVG